MVAFPCRGASDGKDIGCDVKCRAGRDGGRGDLFVPEGLLLEVNRTAAR
jgi:hypothetical protein